MTLTDFFWGLGDIFQWTFQLFEFTGNLINYAFIVIFGFGGLLYWLNIQRKLNNRAKNDPTILK